MFQLIQNKQLRKFAALSCVLGALSFSSVTYAATSTDTSKTAAAAETEKKPAKDKRRTGKHLSQVYPYIRRE